MFDMDYGIDFTNYVYEIDTNIQKRLYVFESQILDDMYMQVNDHLSKMFVLKNAKKILDKLLSHDIIIGPRDDHMIIKKIKKIISKPVYDEYIEWGNNIKMII